MININLPSSYVRPVRKTKRLLHEHSDFLANGRSNLPPPCLFQPLGSAMTMNVDTYTELTPTAIAKMNFATSNHLPELDTSHMDSVDG